MPAAPEETLRKLTATILEAKDAVRELHEARAAAQDVIKSHRKVIADAIHAEVDTVVTIIGNEARNRMIREIENVIGRLERDWREKLGLST